MASPRFEAGPSGIPTHDVRGVWSPAACWGSGKEARSMIEVEQ